MLIINLRLLSLFTSFILKGRQTEIISCLTALPQIKPSASSRLVLSEGDWKSPPRADSTTCFLYPPRSPHHRSLHAATPNHLLTLPVEAIGGCNATCPYAAPAS